MNDHEVLVSGALSFLLQFTRFFGVAPLRFRKNDRQTIISISNTIHIYDCLICTVFTGIELTGLALDMQVDSSRSMRASTPMKQAVWISDLFIVIIITSSGVYGARRGMEQMIGQLKEIYMVNSNLSPARKEELNKRERTMILVVISIFTFLTICNIADVLTHYYKGRSSNKETSILWYYIPYYIQLGITAMLELQFIFLVMSVNSTLSRINNDLGSLDVSLQDATRSNYNMYRLGMLHIENKSINVIIDSIADFSLEQQGSEVKPWVKNCNIPAAGSIRRLAFSYAYVCQIVRQIDDGNDLFLLLIMLSVILHMVVAPYYLFIQIYAWKSVYEMFLQFLYCLFHTLNMILIIEPCITTQKEMERTRVIVGKMISNYQESRISQELDIFFKQLHMNDASWTIMKLNVISRQLIAGIIASVTTYLVIMIQFQLHS